MIASISLWNIICIKDNVEALEKSLLKMRRKLTFSLVKYIIAHNATTTRMLTFKLH